MLSQSLPLLLLALMPSIAEGGHDCPGWGSYRVPCPVGMYCSSGRCKCPWGHVLSQTWSANDCAGSCSAGWVWDRNHYCHDCPFKGGCRRLPPPPPATKQIYPAVSCTSATSQQCKNLAGFAFQSVLQGDANWIDGCFEWYQHRNGQNENTKKVYYNNRPGASTGNYGGNRICATHPTGPDKRNYPDVSCGSASLDQCKNLAGFAFQSVLQGDANWIDGCFEWYQYRNGQNENTKKVYYNNRPGATTGNYGGNRICATHRTVLPCCPTSTCSCGQCTCGGGTNPCGCPTGTCMHWGCCDPGCTSAAAASAAAASIVVPPSQPQSQDELEWPAGDELEWPAGNGSAAAAAIVVPQSQPQSQDELEWAAGYAAAVADFNQGYAAAHGAPMGPTPMGKPSSWFEHQRQARPLGTSTKVAVANATNIDNTTSAMQ